METTDPQDVPSMDRVLESYDSKFRFVLLASRRAEQILQGARPKMVLADEKPCRVAMEELRHSLVGWDYGPAPEPEVTKAVVVESVAPEATAEAIAE